MPGMPGSPEIVLVLGDITTQDVDAIVNAANTALRPGGGVDGAITRGAGPVALAEREAIVAERSDPPLPTGDAVATTGGDLRARWIIHTAGPVYAGQDRDRALLEACHRSCLRVADALGARTVAFPAISTGIYGYPLDAATDVAVRTCRDAETSVDLVRFMAFDDGTLAAYQLVLGK